MKLRLRIDVTDGPQRTSRRVRADELPLALGAAAAGQALFGADAETEPAAWLGHADGAIFVQRHESARAVTLNGDPLEGSAWLSAGDQIRIGTAIIQVGEERGTLVLMPRPPRQVPVLQPPSGPARSKEDALRSDTRPGTGPEPVTPSVSGSKAPGADPDDTPAAPPPLASPRLPGHRPRRLPRVLLGAGIALLAAGALATLLVRPLELVVEPEPEELTIAGTIPPVRYLDRYLALPGTYRLRAGKAGYRPLDETFQVLADAEPSLRYELEKLPGRLEVTTIPVVPGAVEVDGEPAGQLPLEGLELEAGPHAVVIETERYLRLEREIEIEGMGRSQQLVAELEPGWGTVEVSSQPPGAEVRLDGVAVGQTPVMLEPMAGRYRLEVELEGWAPAGRPLDVRAGEQTLLPVFELRKPPGRVELSSRPAGASVLVDGSPAGVTPVALELAGDTAHEIVLDMPGHERARRTVTVKAGEAIEVAVRLEALIGTVFVDARPADAVLTVDGESRGAASQRLRLSAVPHVVEISKPGYRSFRQTVTPDPKRSRKLEVRLERLSAPGGRTEAVPLPQKLPATGYELVRFDLVRPVRFTMGAPRREQGRRSNESLRTVELSQAFLIADREVSNADYRRFEPAHDSGRVFGFDLDRDDQPVSGVSWDAAARYANWLSDAHELPRAYREEAGVMVAVIPMNEGFRLPTEAEWAYVSRYAVGSGTALQGLKYVWGERWPPPPRAGNFADASIARYLRVVVPGYEDGHPVAAPVASFEPNAARLYDTGGNLSEWCHDIYDVYTGSPTAVSVDPSGPGSGRNHVIRGASWRHGSFTELRLSFRDYGREGRDDLGFRIARYVRPPSP